MLNFTPVDKKLLKPQIERNEKGQITKGIAQEDGGRPSLYNPEYVNYIDPYIDFVLNGESKKAKEKLPTIEGFAYYIGVDADTINNWADKRTEEGELINPRFFGAVRKLKNFQKMKLMNDGLYGGKEVNSIMAIFLLKANHGMIDTTNVDLTSKGEKIKASPILGGNTNVQINYGNK